MDIAIQTVLENERVELISLEPTDFDKLYSIASDSKIWEQHPNNDRWKTGIFKSFFDAAIDSKGAYKIIEKHSGEVAGCTRFYNYDVLDNSIMIGYTFYATRHWGTGLNASVKKLMLDYIFHYVNRVYFEVGAANVRSQIAIERLGAIKTPSKSDENKFTYYIDTAVW